MTPLSAAGNYRILAIDDDPVSLAIAAVLLEAEGHSVLQASSGEQALELLARETGRLPDAILADLQMPGLCGSELAGWIRSAAPRAVLLAMSATPPKNADGYDAVLKKPLEVSSFASVLIQAEAGSPFHDTSAVPEVDERVFEALRRAMPAEALAELCTVFFADTESRITQMRELVGAGEIPAVRRLAHTVKGSAAMMGASRLAKAAAALETEKDDPDGRLLRQVEELSLHCKSVESMLLATIESHDPASQIP